MDGEGRGREGTIYPGKGDLLIIMGRGSNMIKFHSHELKVSVHVESPHTTEYISPPPALGRGSLMGHKPRTT